MKSILGVIVGAVIVIGVIAGVIYYQNNKGVDENKQEGASLDISI